MSQDSAASRSMIKEIHLVPKAESFSDIEMKPSSSELLMNEEPIYISETYKKFLGSSCM